MVEPMTTPAQDQRYLEKILSRLPPPDGPRIRRYVAAKAAQGVKASSLRNIATSLERWALDSRAPDLLAMSRDDLVEAIGAMSRHLSQATVDHAISCLRAYVRWHNDDELPKEYRIGTKRLAASHLRDVEPLSREEFSALLEVGEQGLDRRAARRRVALLWLLWDSGLRISEALSLRVRNLRFTESGLHIHLPSPAPGLKLKTGSRAVFVVECAASVRAWLAYGALGPHDWVFSTHTGRPLQAASWSNMLKSLSQQAALRHVNSHLFRHTRATRAARKGWNEPQLRAYFGWSAGSPMPARYVHLAARDMEARILEDHAAPAQEAGMKMCPMCAEDIKTAAVKCKHCGSDVPFTSGLDARTRVA